jgi:hypothetical protein
MIISPLLLVALASPNAAQRYHERRGTNITLAVFRECHQNGVMEMPLRFVDEDYTPRLWAELYPVLRNIKTDELARKMMAYKNKPVASWRADDWGLLDALNQMLTLRATSREHALRNDSPPVQDAAFWAKLDKDLEFYYEAQYPGEELEEDEEDF